MGRGDSGTWWATTLSARQRDSASGDVAVMAWLTKSRFLSGLQCHKRLWFEVHQPLEESVQAGIPILQGRAFDEVVPGVLQSSRMCCGGRVPSLISSK
jgi:hypothetical protein